MKMLFVLAAGLALAGCAEPPKNEIKPGVPYSLSKKEVSLVKRDVASALKDPNSARFGRIAAAKKDSDVVVVCGFVNGRNSYGGYTGEKPFMGVLTANGFLVGSIAGASDSDYIATVRTCQRSGAAI